MKFSIYNNEQMAKCMKYIGDIPTDKGLVVEIYEAKKRRSLNQNDLWHKWIDIMAKSSGDTPSYMKDEVKREILGMREHINKRTGELTYYDYHTAELTKEQFTRLMTQTQVLASEYYGLTLPSPEDYR